MDNEQHFSKRPEMDQVASGESGEPVWTDEALAARFGQWAAEVLRSETPPQGLAAHIIDNVLQHSKDNEDSENPVDAYGLWSALTALTQEIKLQGRTFKQLHDQLAARVEPEPPADDNRHDLSVLLRQVADHLQAQKTDREREIRLEAERKARKELLEVLLDLRDRLIRGNGHEAVPDGITPSWLDRLSGRAGSLERLVESHRARQTGYRMSLERLEEALNQHGVREIPCEGRLFDPRTMNVIDLEETAAHPDGRVLEVYQRGYEWNGQVLRTAQVKVARRPADASTDDASPTADERNADTDR